MITPAAIAGKVYRLGERAGLVLEHEQVIAISIDFEEWIARGSGGEASRGPGRARAGRHRSTRASGRRPAG